MIKQLLTLTFMFISLNTNAQFFKKLFKYSTVYTSGNVSMPMLQDFREFYVTQDNQVVDITREPKFNYRYSIGFRKLARFDYENRQNEFYNGSERPITLSSGVGAVENFEWLANYDWVRNRGDVYNNQRYFLRYLGPWYIIKGELREEGAIDLHYLSADVRARLKIGEKLNLSLGGIYRTSDKVFGLNPIEEYLAPDTVNWWDLAYDYGYVDHWYAKINANPITGEWEETHDWFWTDEDLKTVAASDEEFRRHIFKNIVNNYNQEIFNQIDRMAYVSLVAGYDFYHYTDNFWFHNYLSVMPLHKQIEGDEEFGYGAFYADANEGKKHWLDYQVGLVLGLKIKRWFGIFAEGEYSKLWDKNIYNAQIGFNVNFR